MKIFCYKTKKFIVIPNNVEAFLFEYEELCKKHNLSLSHEDGHGSFVIEDFDQYNINWVIAAYMNINSSSKEESDS